MRRFAADQRCEIGRLINLRRRRLIFKFRCREQSAGLLPKVRLVRSTRCCALTTFGCSDTTTPPPRFTLLLFSSSLLPLLVGSRFVDATQITGVFADNNDLSAAYRVTSTLCRIDNTYSNACDGVLNGHSKLDSTTFVSPGLIGSTFNVIAVLSRANQSDFVPRSTRNPDSK